MERQKVIVVYSGGMDSYTLLMGALASAGDLVDVHAISFNYGQRHVKELEYACEVCQKLGISHTVVEMKNIGRQLLSGSSQTDDSIPVPEGHYEDENMKLTVVPNRNMIMLSLAVGYAVSIGADTVLFGVHSGDHAIYPDCRPEFVSAMNTVAGLANYEGVLIHAPFLDMTKGDIAKEGKRLMLDYGNSWTCYKGDDKACGKCGACQERLEAMQFAGIIDPLEYEDV